MGGVGLLYVREVIVMVQQEQARSRLLNVLKPLVAEKREFLENMKRDGVQWERQDFIWHALLGAFSTWGSSRGWAGLMENPDNYNRVTFDVLMQYSPPERLTVLENTLRNAKVRMPRKKAEYLAKNFDTIVEMGGVAAVKEQLSQLPGRKQKVKFLKRFVGIGDKYARDMMMDIYHPDFRDSIAVDTRIKNITERLGIRFDTYEEYEEFYLGVAEEAGLNGWELDRLLYNFEDDILAQLP